MAITHDDTGSMGVGLSTMTIATVVHIVEEFTPDETVNTTPTIDQDGNAAGSFGITGLKTATAVLQKPASGAEPAVGGETSAYEGETWIITAVNLAKKIGEQHKYNVSLVKKYN